MLDAAGLGEWIKAHWTRTKFRLETLDHLDVSTDEDWVGRYLAGDPAPHRPWEDAIRSQVADGLITYRVHVVRSPLSDYLRYAMEWGYVGNAAAGERIRIIDLAEQSEPEQLIWQDFWLLDDLHLALMHYDGDGKFAGAEPVTDLVEVGRYRDCARAAWDVGRPFEDYWSAHPEAHRDRTQRSTTYDDHRASG